MKYVIIGFIKCGQVSLKKMLEAQGHEVERYEVATHHLGPRMIKKTYPEYEPVIITRDPIKRIWSQYQYLKETKFHDKSFEDYLDIWNTHHFWFHENPIFQSHYEEHLPRWPNAIIYKFEDLIKDPNFPHENPTKTKTAFPDEYRKLAEEKLEEYRNVYRGKIKVKAILNQTPSPK